MTLMGEIHANWSCCMRPCRLKDRCWCLCVQMLRDYGQRSCQLLQLLTSSPPPSQASLLDQLSLVHITQDLQQISLLTTQLQVGHPGTLVGGGGVGVKEWNRWLMSRK